MTDYETLAALGFTEPVAKSSEAAPLLQQVRPDGVAVARENTELPSRRSLRTAAASTGVDAASAVSAPARPGSRRAVREAAASAQPRGPVREAIPAVPSPAAAGLAPQGVEPQGLEPRVAAPFGTFDAAAASAGSSRRARTRATKAAIAPAAATRAGAIRKRLSVAGTMLLVGGLFASLTLPAYASIDANGGAVDAAARVDGQALALNATAIGADTTASGDARDGYDSTSAADLKRLYREALRQQRMAEYLASGAMELGDDYPWATELGMSQGGGLSPLNYFVRQCTDFVAWRLNRDAGSTTAPFKYTWSFLTPGGGSAHSWKYQWEQHGWTVSTTPAAGWVAWFPGANHVAYVNSVLADGSVFIEEYNWGADVYNQRIIEASEAIYLSPPPA
ncbi:MAG: CHAP domain-containing protein [Protaetiibacter sp.]